MAEHTLQMAYQVDAGCETQDSWMLMSLMVKMRCQDDTPL